VVRSVCGGVGKQEEHGAQEERGGKSWALASRRRKLSLPVGNKRLFINRLSRFLVL